MSFRSSYRDIALYSPNRIVCRVDLSDNTNLWGAPPEALRAIEDSPESSITRYPPAYAHVLKEKLGVYLGVAPSWIVTGCGSDDVLDSAMRAFAEPGERIAFPSPTFSMIDVFARVNGLEPHPVQLTRNYDADVDALVGTGAKIIYLCSPNNPTGTVLSRPAIERIVEAAPGVVLLDEAYAEFADSSAVDLLKSSENLVITRTMSKAFGLAGLRLGYAAAPPRLAAEIEKARGPYKVSSVAARAGLAALTGGVEWVRERVTEAKRMRARLTSELERRGMHVLPSQANFVLVRADAAARVADEMRSRGVAVRAFAALAGIGDALRITVAPWELLSECLETLDAAVACE